MKKYILIIAAVFAAALLVPGCYPNENVELNTKGLTISLFSDEPETKADPTRETTIDHFDYFFFKNANGTELIDVTMQGRASGSSKTFETGLGKDFVKLRKVTSYVYIIANYPEEIDHTQAWTLEQLKALEFESKLVKAVDEETGAVTFFTDMVMDSFNKTSNTYTTELTPALVDEARTVSIGLTRIASKLVLNFTLPASIAGSMTGENEAWTPVLKDLRAYYVNALNTKSTVGATPIQRSDASAGMTKEDYFSYPTNYPISPDPLTATPTDGKYKFNTGEVYTYPQTWTAGENGEPYFKIQLTWYSNIRGTANFYYKICVPKPATDGTVTIDRNTCYVVDVTLDVIDTENEYVVIDPANYTVHEWAIHDWKGGGGMGSARFFNVPKKEFTLYSEESVDIPFASSSAVTAYFTEVSYWYYGSANGTHYEFRFDPEDKVDQVTLPTNTDSNGTSLAVQDCWGSNTNAARDRNQYSLTVNNKYVTFSHPLANIFSRREIKLTLVNEEGRSANVVITQRPAIEIIKHPTKNGFLDGRFNIGEPEVCDQYGNLIGKGHQTTHISAKYYYQSNVGWPSSGATYNYGAKSWYGSLYSGGSTTVASDHYFITEVSISAFDEDNNKYQYRVGSSTSGTVYEKDYRLGDPRVSAEDAGYTTETFVLPSYLVTDSKHRTPVSSGGNGHGYAENNATAEYAAWEEPLKILIASQQEGDRNVIAPRFLVSSSMNITGGVDWNTDGGRGIVQRCAMRPVIRPVAGAFPPRPSLPL